MHCLRNPFHFDQLLRQAPHWCLSITTLSHKRGVVDEHHCAHCGQRLPKPKLKPAPEGHARCTICAGVFSLCNFHVDKSKRNGHSPRCKDCANAKNLAQRDKVKPERKRYGKSKAIFVDERGCPIDEHGRSVRPPISDAFNNHDD